MKIIQNSPHCTLYNSLLIVESIPEIPLKLSRDGRSHSFGWHKITFIFIFNFGKSKKSVGIKPGDLEGWSNFVTSFCKINIWAINVVCAGALLCKKNRLCFHESLVWPIIFFTIIVPSLLNKMQLLLFILLKDILNDSAWIKCHYCSGALCIAAIRKGPLRIYKYFPRLFDSTIGFSYLVLNEELLNEYV
jgi:hypothetical protein